MTALAGRVALVTGGSGSLGVDFLPLLAQQAPREIRVLVRSEAAADRVREALETVRVDVRIAMGDIRDPRAVAEAVDDVDVIFHLAAEKDVLRSEENPAEAVSTNVGGSAALVEAASQQPRAPFLVAASSAKAAEPSGVLGMTKALMERLICASGIGCSVRFGNIFGSTDSVLDIWRRTVRERGEIDVTDPEMTRFVLTAKEASGYLIAAAERGCVGTIVVPSQRAFRLGDLAAAFAVAYGARLREVGPRQTETRHEALVTPTEATYATRDGEWIVLTPGALRPGGVPLRSNDVTRLREAELTALIRENTPG